METLFSLKPAWPSGFVCQDEFITDAEEQMLIAEIRKYDLHNALFHGSEAKRKVISFGHDYNFADRSLLKGRPMPSQFMWLINRIAKFVLVEPNDFAELLLSEYKAGAAIGWHRDAFPFELIAGVSLLSDCTFEFRPYHKEKLSRKALVSYPVPRRSLYVIQGPARWLWENRTAAAAQPGYTVTLRTLRP